MSVLLGVLALNEMEWLPRLYEQHRDWPGLIKMVFVEGADQAYAAANPTLVSPDGLSIDGTTAFLRDLAARDPRVVYIPHGIGAHPDPAVGKAAIRQRYLEVAGEVKPEFVIALDADEFYIKADQQRLLDWMRERPDYSAFTFPRREIWRPPHVIKSPLFHFEAVGRFWSMACCHWWRWEPGMHHGRCHVAPDGADGTTLNERMCRLHNEPDAPQMIHLGYASSGRWRRAKVKYYVQRGEGKSPQTRMYTRSRAAWDEWRPGVRLPAGGRVIRYKGPIPEVFQ